MYFKKRISFLETSIVRNVDFDGSKAELQQLPPVNTTPLRPQEARWGGSKGLAWRGVISLSLLLYIYLFPGRKPA